MPLGELQRVSQHVELRESGLTSLARPVLLYVIHCCTPLLDLLQLPVVLVEKMIMQTHEPSLEGRVGRLLLGGQSFLLLSSGAERCTVALLEPLANLRPVQLEDIASSTTASRVDRLHSLQRLFDQLLREEFAESIEDNAIADAEEEVEWCGDDAIRVDGEKRPM